MGTRKAQSTAGYVSLRQYAAMRKDRKLPGGTHAAVRKAIASGRLSKSVRANAKGAPLINPALADQEWQQKTDPAQTREIPTSKGPKQPSLFGGDEAPRPGDGSGQSEDVVRIRKAQADKLRFNALIVELDYRNRARELVEAAAVDRAVTKLVGAVLKDLRAIPDRICSHLASVNDAHRVKMILQGAIDQACRDLSDGKLDMEREG